MLPLVRLVARRRIGRALQMSAIVLCSACTEECDSPLGPDYQVVVVGRVTLDGEPLPGIRIGGVSATPQTTDADGRYNVTVQSETNPISRCVTLESEPYGSVVTVAGQDGCFTLYDGESAAYDFDFVQEGPTVTIQEPQDAARIASNQTTLLVAVGSASVRINGFLSPGVRYVDWSSSLDGSLESAILGGVAFATLSDGTHVLTASVTNALGATASDQVTVEVGDGVENQPPVATITAPAYGVSYPSGTAVDFAGTGEDPEDGALTGMALAWTSSVEGPIGTGTSFSRVMADGSHLIVLTVTDAQGLAGADTIAIHVSGTTGTIQGTVSFFGDPLNAVPVELTGAATASTSTNGQGMYSFTDLGPGTYTITITPPDGLDMTTVQTVDLAEGQTLTVNFSG